MPKPLAGLHHVTAIAGNPQENIDFYTGFLGLRLVKQTVNFDDPSTYHFYYGDGLGQPGSILTFFPFDQIIQGRSGQGMATHIAFSIPEDALDFWIDRFAGLDYAFGNPEDRFGETVIGFQAPDGLQLELISHPTQMVPLDWSADGVPAQHAVRSFHSVTLMLQRPERTAYLLTDVMGYNIIHEDDDRIRLSVEEQHPAAAIDLVKAGPTDLSRNGGGTVHHIAFRVPDEATQLAWRERLLASGMAVTEVKDRQYFRSIYFREPGGVLFEIATDPPGFTADESTDELGRTLQLPAWLEERRTAIERRLIPITPQPR